MVSGCGGQANRTKHLEGKGIRGWRSVRGKPRLPKEGRKRSAFEVELNAVGREEVVEDVVEVATRGDLRVQARCEIRAQHKLTADLQTR